MLKLLPGDFNRVRDADTIMANLSSPTPLASAISALGFLALIALLYGLVALWRGRPGRDDDRTGLFDHLISGCRALDRRLVHLLSWVTGTRYRKRYIRLPVLLAYFLSVTAGGVFLAWPFSLAAIGFGVFSILIVFRHWSRDEDEAVENVSFDRKDIRIDGALGAEVLIAVGFLFVFVPIAFAQLQQQGLGFDLRADAGPLTFLLYMLIETVKAGSLVDYYDLYADRLGFDRIGAPANPTDWAKATVMGYRLSLNLLVLAAIKRLIDVARRRAEGADLRTVTLALRQGSAQRQDAAIDTLADFALRGRANARDLLEKMVEPGSSGAWSITPEARFKAAGALLDYGTQRGGAGALYAAADGYRALLREGFDRAGQASQWRATAHNLGNTLVQLGQQIGDPRKLVEASDIYQDILSADGAEAGLSTLLVQANVFADLAMMTGEKDNLDRAVETYRIALQRAGPDAPAAELAVLNCNLGATLADLAAIDSDAQRARDAIAAYRAALDQLTPEDEAETWSMTQNNLANALADLGHWTGEGDALREAICAHEAALSVRTRSRTPLLWATSQTNLGNAWSRLARQQADTAALDQAVQHYQAALSVFQRDDLPGDWAWTQALLGAAEIDRGAMLPEADAPAAYAAACVHLDGAIDLYDSADMPGKAAWAKALKGNALVALARYDAAAQAYRSALLWQTPENAGDDWVLSVNNLAASLHQSGQAEAAASVLAEALAQRPDETRLQATQARLGLVSHPSAETGLRHYRVSIQSVCGEFVIGTVSPAFYAFWKDRDDFEAQILNIGDPELFDPDSPPPHESGDMAEGWYALDTLAHINNALLNGNRLYVDEVVPDESAYSGFELKPGGYSETFEIDALLPDMPETFCTLRRAYAVETGHDAPVTPVFVGKSIEKGAQTDVYMTTRDAFDPRRLAFDVWMMDGDPVIAAIRYDGEDLDIIPDSSTGKAFYAYLGALD